MNVRLCVGYVVLLFIEVATLEAKGHLCAAWIGLIGMCDSVGGSVGTASGLNQVSTYTIASYALVIYTSSYALVTPAVTP